MSLNQIRESSDQYSEALEGTGTFQSFSRLYREDTAT